MFPEPPPPELAPSCAEAGVLGVMPGVFGLLQAVETLKILLDIGEPLVGRQLTYDALSGEFFMMKTRPNPTCPWCSEGAEFPGYEHVAEVCASSPPGK
jgi:molybdopterin/thiamine biosynthesis adenylyltransferase